MNKSFEKKVINLYKSEKKLELLQIAYVMLFIAVTVVSGLIALINQPVGVAFLIIPLICLVAWSMNMVAWSIVKTAVEHFYPDVLKKDEPKPKAKKTTKKAKK